MRNTRRVPRGGHSTGRVCSHPRAPDFVERFSAFLQHSFNVPALRITVENARQKIVDCNLCATV